ncbi:YkvI family membrane protein [Ammoniphilus resinae]|uniref:Membrane protein YkvI n=1 Tax=Ammoniphilus resinae TaxID=861532 RepID=A0ABS4GMX3_9BACL|nr:hypothetical protein [Ammoniphilus resinae]MBP1931625.1 putative membrane protein YkvI [Ammoniphilus resinae]
MGKQIKMIFLIAATYIGTVVGAGFATGKEVVEFFTQYGSKGLVGVLISSILFIWLGTKVMIIANRIGAYSYQELTEYLFGKKIARWFNIVVLMILLGVTSVMLSGTGAIFQEQLGLPYQAGVVITLVLSYLVMIKGLQGVMVVNSLVVPMILGFSILIGVEFILKLDDWSSLFTGASLTRGTGSGWMMSPLIYVSLNLAMAQAVLVPLGKEIDDEKVLKWGGIFGGIGLCFMLLVSHLALVNLPEVLAYEIPMGVYIKEYGLVVHLLFLFVIYGEIFTTLIGNVFGLARQIHSASRISEQVLIIIILIISYLISLVGFSSLLTYLYPAFGYMGIVFLVMLAIRRHNEKKSNKK